MPIVAYRHFTTERFDVLTTRYSHISDGLLVTGTQSVYACLQTMET